MSDAIKPRPPICTPEDYHRMRHLVYVASAPFRGMMLDVLGCAVPRITHHVGPIMTLQPFAVAFDEETTKLLREIEEQRQAYLMLVVPGYAELMAETHLPQL